MVVVLNELAMTVSEKFRVNRPLFRSREKLSRTGLVVSMVYRAASRASMPFLSGLMDKSFMSLIPYESATSHEVAVEVAIFWALMLFRSSSVMMMVMMVLSLYDSNVPPVSR